MTDLTYAPPLPAGPDDPSSGGAQIELVLHGDGTEGPDEPVTSVPQPPGCPDVPALPDDSDDATGDDDAESSQAGN